MVVIVLLQLNIVSVSQIAYQIVIISRLWRPKQYMLLN